jgi:Family of unknown function (DUF6786)
VTIVPPQTYESVVGFLRRASVPLQEMQGNGHVAVMEAAGRIIAISFSRTSENLLWSNPLLSDTLLVKYHPDQLVGGFGGDRLWFAPEVDYHWDGPPRWDTFENYRVPPEADPGRYEFTRSTDRAIGMRASAALIHRATGQRLTFEVHRSVSLTSPPGEIGATTLSKLDYVGIQTCHTLSLDPHAHIGRVDLWHLLQMPADSVLLVPLNRSAHDMGTTILSYGQPGGWIEEAKCLRWRFTGTALAKLGVSVNSSTGRAAVLRQLNPERWCLLVRQFPIHLHKLYADHPYGVPRTDQVFQAWDGFGFGEMEYHSPMLDAQRGPRSLEDSDYLWAFGGTLSDLRTLLATLLGIDVSTTDL